MPRVTAAPTGITKTLCTATGARRTPGAWRLWALAHPQTNARPARYTILHAHSVSQSTASLHGCLWLVLCTTLVVPLESRPSHVPSCHSSNYDQRAVPLICAPTCMCCLRCGLTLTRLPTCVHVLALWAVLGVSHVTSAQVSSKPNAELEDEHPCGVPTCNHPSKRSQPPHVTTAPSHHHMIALPQTQPAITACQASTQPTNQPTNQPTSQPANQPT